MTLTAYQADTLVTLAGSAPGYGLVRQGAVVVEGGEIAWVGAAADLPAGYGAARRVHFGDRVITPGLIDCHTHIVFGGDRTQEFETRLNGADYEAIARACRGRSTRSGQRGLRPSSIFDATALPWRWRRTATPALRR